MAKKDTFNINIDRLIGDLHINVSDMKKGMGETKKIVTQALLDALKFLPPPTEKDILTFIEYMRSEIKERPQCMMFAMLLKLKFDGAELYYDNNHFITMIEGRYYDWDGEVKNPSSDFSEFPETYGDNHIVNHYFAIRNRFINN